MMNSSMKEITLENIAGGVAAELFNRELKAIGRNIADVNTKSKTKRSITLTFDFTPDEDREEVSLSVMSVSKLAPVKECSKTIYFGKERTGEGKFYEQEIQQTDLFEETENVSQLNPKGVNNV